MLLNLSLLHPCATDEILLLLVCFYFLEAAEVACIDLAIRHLKLNIHPR